MFINMEERNTVKFFPQNVCIEAKLWGLLKDKLWVIKCGKSVKIAV